jgi:hypothetical protein
MRLYHFLDNVFLTGGTNLSAFATNTTTTLNWNDNVAMEVILHVAQTANGGGEASLPFRCSLPGCFLFVFGKVGFDGSTVLN